MGTDALGTFPLKRYDHVRASAGSFGPRLRKGKRLLFGGAVISADDENQLVALYTRHYEENGNIFETQCKTVSTDGVNFKKCGEVIGEKDLPPFSDIRNFRDPNPVYIEGRYYVVVGNQSNDGRGRILVYVSDDLKKFKSLFYDRTQQFRSDGGMSRSFPHGRKGCARLFRIRHAGGRLAES